MLVAPVRSALKATGLREPLGRLHRGFRDPSMWWVHLAAPTRASVEQAVVQLCPQATLAQAAGLRRELLADALLVNDLRVRVAEGRAQQPPGSAHAARLARLEAIFASGHLTDSPQGMANLAFIYSVLRVLGPRVTVETGTFDGRCAAVMARALERNGTGRLVSIDLPAYTPIPRAIHVSLPAGLTSGWLIPERLRRWCDVRLGDSRQVLPVVLKEHATIDCFLHDSLHTEAHMRFEYEEAWARLIPGGILLSDDIFLTPAFHRFCGRLRQPYVHLGTFGGMRKPA